MWYGACEGRNLKQTKFLVFNITMRHFYALIKYDLIWGIFLTLIQNDLIWGIFSTLIQCSLIWGIFFSCFTTHVKKCTDLCTDLYQITLFMHNLIL